MAKSWTGWSMSAMNSTESSSHLDKARMRRRSALAAPSGVPVADGAQPETATRWKSYGSDNASSKYSPLDQIRASNFKNLRIAWTWRSADEAVCEANPQLKTWVWEATPLMVG